MIKQLWNRHWPLVATALIIAACWGLSRTAHAAGASYTLAWTAPTAYTDTSALPASDIAYYTVSINGTAQKVSALKLATTVPCGSATVTVTATTTATAKYPNATSGPAGPVTYVSGITCVPNPPGALTAQ